MFLLSSVCDGKILNNCDHFVVDHAVLILSHFTSSVHKHAVPAEKRNKKEKKEQLRSALISDTQNTATV